jgi:ribosomal protein S18 acetylase RimI-like enzyme
MIRRLEHADLAAFRTVRLEALRLHPEAFGSSYDEEALHSLDEFSRFLTPPSSAFGAFADDRLIGIAALFVPSRPKRRHKGHLSSVYVASEFRGGDVARGLVEAVIIEARQSQLKALLLAVTVGNEAARRLYLSQGFQVFGTERDAMMIDGVLYDEELMTLELE